MVEEKGVVVDDGTVGSSFDGTCKCLVLMNSTHLNLFVHNYVSPGSPIQECQADVHVSGLQFPHKAAAGSLRRIDDNHTNPRGYWIKEMGMFSGYPTPDQIIQLKKASEILVMPMQGVVTGTVVEFNNLKVPPQSIAVLSLPYQGAA
eukprot:TRINITY_DN67945_c7_g2_i1.p1 TRINITY_DN67945_c7_g2~~TRINITY_DN67945_c7_g2_i1.p1  ORF type:complete len:156 (-),score=24.26 TRINITY_DN67945_c7_g2_i1:15-455(-)